MARKKDGEINEHGKYRVSMAKAVKHGKTWLRPSQQVMLSGATLIAIKQGDATAVASYEEVAA